DAEGPAADDAGPVHFPDHGLPVARVLPENVGVAVAIEVAGPDRGPARPGIGDGPAADDAGPVHLPDRHLPICVLPQDVGMAVAVEVAGADLVPARPGIGRQNLTAPGDLAGPVHFPDGDLAVVVVPLDVGE